MCGIAGIYSSREVDLNLACRMSESMKHRGPDDYGQVLLDNSKLVLMHRRLSILDLSEKGHQPMRVDDVWITYNGEVYNFRDLRTELGCEFVSQSDTEVIVRCYQKWGVECFSKLNGMFALAIWDGRKLVLARDRYGIKPLYHCSTNESLTFASTIKPLLLGTQHTNIDLLALKEYFTFQNIISDRTLFQGIRSLPPGCYMEVEL